MPSPSGNNNITRAVERKLPTLSKVQANILWGVGLVLVLASVGMVAFEVFNRIEISKTDLLLHGGIVGVGLILMVPRRMLALVEQLLKTKWFAKK